MSIKEIIRDLTRGYTDQELATERRIHRGEITPDDRTRFRSEESNRQFTLLTGGGPYSPTRDLLNPPSLALFFGLNRLTERVKELNNLSASEIDQLLVQQASANLKSWHQLPKTPRIIQPLPRFMQK